MQKWGKGELRYCFFHLFFVTWFIFIFFLNFIIFFLWLPNMQLTVVSCTPSYFIWFWPMHFVEEIFCFTVFFTIMAVGIVDIRCIQFGGISTFSSLGYFGVGLLPHFRLKKLDKKTYKIHKPFELYQIFKYNFCGKLS